MLVINDDILKEARLNADELRIEIAAYLFSINKLSFGSARALAGIDVWSFQEFLAKRNIPLHYGMDELKDDLKILNET